jgi:beta-lactamase superfamily II metal-dependent hydrolase
MPNISKYEIDMLDVGAADAFIIHAFVSDTTGTEKEYVVLVDAGNEADGKVIRDHIQNYYTQQYIDLAIITHCDVDHYGGMQYLIDKHNDTRDIFKIKKVWVHDPYNHVNLSDVKYVRNNNSLRERLNAAYSFSDGSNLLKLLDDSGITRKEVFRGDECSILNLKVLGPDRNYYESLIPNFRVNVDFRDEFVDDVYLYDERQTEDEFYSKTLEDALDDQSSVNQSSIIFLFEPNNLKYLFTGDAGKDALHRIIKADNYNRLSNIDWLKVPHHGSKHNLDNHIISYFHPKVSYLSTEKIGKFANRCTINALKKVGDVYSTHKVKRAICHSCNTNKREDYSKIESL